MTQDHKTEISSTILYKRMKLDDLERFEIRNKKERINKTEALKV